MKRYRPARDVLEEVDALLGEGLSPRSTPLERVLEILREGRQYARMGIYLDGVGGRQTAAVNGGEPDRIAAARCGVPIKIAGRVLGEIVVQSAPQRLLGSEDRVLLKHVAARLARFLTGSGKRVLLKFQQAEWKPGKPLGAAAGGKSRQA